LDSATGVIADDGDSHVLFSGSGYFFGSGGGSSFVSESVLLKMNFLTTAVIDVGEHA
jgi:hypothetical protein